jgi:hypothetical protein
MTTFLILRASSKSAIVLIDPQASTEPHVTAHSIHAEIDK